jgi:hypothetical protein
MIKVNYDPTRVSPYTNAIVWTVFALLLSSAFYYSLTTTLDDLTRRDCAAGVQKACEAIK